jgi:hypothetical protein
LQLDGFTTTPFGQYHQNSVVTRNGIHHCQSTRPHVDDIAGGQHCHFTSLIVDKHHGVIEYRQLQPLILDQKLAATEGYRNVINDNILVRGPPQPEYRAQEIAFLKILVVT